MKTEAARPDEAIHRLTEELNFIVKSADLRGLDIWIKRYIRRIGVSFPMAQATKLSKLDPIKATQMSVCAHLGVGVSKSAIWSEKLDVQNAEKSLHAELYFLDVLGAMPPEGEGEG